MQNFWWNRKFYHGRPEPDSYRLSRLEETSSTTAETLSALSKAQTATDALNDAQGKLLGEHTALLSHLTDIAASTQEDVEQVVAECDSISNELTALEQNDNVLSARIDGIEEACADTSAEQATRLNQLESATAEFPKKLTVLENKLTSTRGEGMGYLPFQGYGCTCNLLGSYPAGGVTLFSESYDAANLYLSPINETQLIIPPGSGVLFGSMDGIKFSDGEFEVINLSQMPMLKKIGFCDFVFHGLVMPSKPILYEVVLERTNGVTVDLQNQTQLFNLTMVNCHANVRLPDTLPNLEYVVLDSNKAQDEDFLKKYLFDRSQTSPGRVSLSGATPPDWLAERNWTVIG